MPEIPDITKYPDDVQLSDEAERAIREAIRGPAASEAPIGSDDAASAAAGQTPDAEVDFSHLAPPKKHAGKIFLKVLFIIALIGAVGFGAWYFWWTQYATFDYTLQPYVVLDGETVSPNVFIPESEIARGISASFKNPDFAPASGPMTVPLVLSLGLRSMDADANLYVLTPLSQLTYEYKEETHVLEPVDLLKNPEIARNIDYDIAFTEMPLPLSDYKVGGYTLHAALNGVPFSVNLAIEDTTLPIATVQEVPVWVGDEVSPEDFFTDISDNSEITSVVFAGDLKGQESISAYQNQIIEIDITDEHGNTNTYGVSLTVLRNESPPVFKGVPSRIESMVDTPVIFPMGIVAQDDFRRNLEFTIDDSDVDISEVGQYSIQYIAEDYSGLRTEINVPLFIIDVDPAEVDEWVNAKIADIIKDDMTDEQKLRAIFEAVRKTLTPVDSGTAISGQEWTGSLYTPAHYAINNSRGTYYHYYALSQLLLTRAGFESVLVERSESARIAKPHFWNLVEVDGEWYHFDSMFITNWNDYNWINGIQHMFTQKQAEEIAAALTKLPAVNRDGYYDYVSEADVKAE